MARAAPPPPPDVTSCSAAAPPTESLIAPSWVDICASKASVRSIGACPGGPVTSCCSSAKCSVTAAPGFATGAAGAAGAPAPFSSLLSGELEAFASAFSARLAAAEGSSAGVRLVSFATMVSSTLSGELPLPRMPRLFAAFSALPERLYLEIREHAVPGRDVVTLVEPDDVARQLIVDRERRRFLAEHPCVLLERCGDLAPAFAADLVEDVPCVERRHGFRERSAARPSKHGFEPLHLLVESQRRMVRAGIGELEPAVGERGRCCDRECVARTGDERGVDGDRAQVLIGQQRLEMPDELAADLRLVRVLVFPLDCRQGPPSAPGPPSSARPASGSP